MRSYINRQIALLNNKLNVRSAQVDAMKDDVKAAQDFEARTCNPLWLMSDDIESDQKEIERLADTCSPLEEHDLLTAPRSPPGPSTHSSEQQTADNRYLQDLYNALIQPIEEHLTGSKLLIVPEGPLFTLPFAALLDPSGSHLCDKYSLQFIPSLLVLDSCLLTRPPPELGQALFVGNPKIDNLSTLQFAEKEAIDCSKIFNAQPLVLHMATKKNVLNGMKTASIIHIAAHGNMNRAEIFLTPNEGEPLSPSSYLLTAEDIQKCTLNARLVVLSCCYSGCGKISSEGVVGTARSFLGSGARAVLVALWPINDEATMELVIELYKKLTQEYSLCAALQQAMMVLKRRYLSPTVWAPFQIFGEDIVLTKQEIEKIRLVSASR
jgi:CHAT domain-containing protein